MSQIIKEICVNLDADDCPSNPFYLAWKGFASYQYWLFGFNQRFNRAVSRGDVFDRNIVDLTSVNGTSEYLTQSGRDTVLLQANNLTLDEYKSLRRIFTSPRIYQMFKYVDDNGDPINRDANGDPERIELMCISTPQPYDSKNSQFDLSIELAYPKLFTESN